MKKLISLISAFAILLGCTLPLCSCDSGNESSENDNEELKEVFESLDELNKTAAEKDGSVEKALGELAAKIDAMANVPEKSDDGDDEKLAEIKDTLDALSEDEKKASSSDKAKIAELEKQIKALTDKLNYKEPEYVSYASEAYEKVKYIDSVLPDRDIYNGENFVLCQKWIHTCLLQAGYSESDIEYQDVAVTKYVKTTDDLKKLYPAVKSFETDGKKYNKSGRNYVESDEGTYTKATFITQNIIVTKKGKSDKQIIVGMHYDGDGTGDNGSGIALGLVTAEKFCKVTTPYTIKFVFFTGEEYGMLGSSVYANSLSEAEVKNTLYMINMDSLICGDYCYLYGGVQDNKTKTVTATEAYDKAMKVAKKIGLEFKSNPWTWDNLSPDDEKSGVPSYASPSTGNWSDHAPFEKIGIPYLYFEATNWEIPDYTGYGETYLIGMLMNTKNDYLEYIEKYFPGRAMHHLEMFSKLLNELLVTE